jgi:hypothetical protein
MDEMLLIFLNTGKNELNNLIKINRGFILITKQMFRFVT